MRRNSKGRKHDAVLVEVGPWSEEIDIKIAPLIRELWIAGIETWMSCQEDGWGKVWIAFLELTDLTNFLNIVAEFEDGRETLYNRVNPQWPCETPDQEWILEMHPDDTALINVASRGGKPAGIRHDGPSDFFFTFSVRFPPSDLPVVFARLQKFNEEQETSGAPE